MKRSRKTAGGLPAFTMVEVLVILVIIALLSSILFPVFAQAQSKARQASCLSNLKQLGIAHLMYWQDYDETTVTSWSCGFPGDFSWYVQPYLKNLKVLLCPSHTASAEEYGHYCNGNYLPGGIDNPTGEMEMWGYGYNTGHLWANDTGLTINAKETLSGTYTVSIQGKTFTARYRVVPLLGVPLSRIVSPAQTIMLGDTGDTMVPGLGREWLPLTSPIADQCERLRKFNWPRHNGGNNMVYADGHAKWYQFNNTILNDGLPAVVPDVCQYFRDYDGTNNPGNCKNGLTVLP
jgi:prepilin-type processing-associated H-X9-DG protein